MSPPRHGTQSGERSMPERVAILETLVDERQASAERQGERMGTLEERIAKLEQFMAREEAREEVAREAARDARLASVLSKVGFTTGTAGTIYAVWEIVKNLGG